MDFEDPALPVRASLQVLNPLVPLDVETSSLPVVMATVTLTNDCPLPVHGLVGLALQNAVGYDGVTPIDGVRAPCYGGNTNRVVRVDGWTHVLLENHALPPDHPGAGQMVAAADSPYAPVLCQWREPEDFFSFLRGRTMGTTVGALDRVPQLPDAQLGGPMPRSGPSGPGETWNGGIAVPFDIPPGATASIRFLLAWHFPQRYVNFPQFGHPEPQWGPTRFWLGNHYTTRFADALDVARHVQGSWEDLCARTEAWTRSLNESGLGAVSVEHLAAQVATIRSPSCFRAADGRFFGFEGINGASTRGHAGDAGGSCPMNCTHVWNYAQAVARLFPELERSMRDTEIEVMQAPDGSVPHRVIVPTYLRQLWDRPIGGPDEPALDGMLGVVLKHLREVRNGAGVPWLRQRWPALVRLMEHITSRWDPDRTGVLSGIQPSTHDIDLRGTNPYMGLLWLAALRAMEELARIVDDVSTALSMRATFESGSRGYDEAMFTGDHFRQVLSADEPDRFQWRNGVLTDQLLGQWWAHQLSLGYLVPRSHIVTALRTIVRCNLRTGFDPSRMTGRAFADGPDAGLIMCTWPDGGQPSEPLRYSDEVWTGSEYQVAAHCLLEGLDAEAAKVLDALWARYDGSRRNPYNHIECGDHYVRSLSGWSVFDAMTGQQWNAVTSTLRLRRLPPAGLRWPVVTSQGWGTVHTANGLPVLECAWGSFDGVRVLVGEGAP